MIWGKKDNNRKQDSTPPDESTYIVCPVCTLEIEVHTSARPVSVYCHRCILKLTVSGERSEGTGEEVVKATSPLRNSVFYECPLCSSAIPVLKKERPLRVKCNGCKTEFNLKQKFLHHPPEEENDAIVVEPLAEDEESGGDDILSYDEIMEDLLAAQDRIYRLREDLKEKTQALVVAEKRIEELQMEIEFQKEKYGHEKDGGSE